MNLEELKTINGNKFLFRVEDKEAINVLSAGYIITPNGHFVNVKDDESHSNIFSNYLNSYLENSNNVHYDVFKAIITLLEFNHIVYLGIKQEDMPNIYNKIGSSTGFCILFIPDNLELLSEEQKFACLNLIKTNHSILGDYEKLDLHIKQIGINQLNKEQFIEFISNNIKK